MGGVRGFEGKVGRLRRGGSGVGVGGWALDDLFDFFHVYALTDVCNDLNERCASVLQVSLF